MFSPCEVYVAKASVICSLAFFVVGFSEEGGQ